MKKVKSTVSVILCLGCFFMTFGCSEKPADQSGSPSSSNGETDSSHSSSETIETTDTWFINDGKSEYTIVYDEDIPANQQTAISELKILLYQATGIDFPVKTVKENEFSDFDETKKFLSVGDNDWSKVAGIEYSKSEIGSNGTHLETKGNSVFMSGGSYWGVLNSVYDFLELQLGYDYLGTDCEIFDEVACRNAKLIKVNQNNIPAFEYRFTFCGTAFMNKTFRNRMRMQSMADIYYSDADIPSVHNTLAYTGYRYKAANCEQLCYTQYKEEIAETAFEYIRDNFIEVDDSKSVVTFTQMDNNSWCNCSSCTEFIAAHGGCASSTQIPVCNLIQKKINEYMENNHPDRLPVSLLFFSYWSTQDAPAIRNPDGTYSIYNDLKFEENLGVFCALMGADWRTPITENKAYYENLKKWSLYTDIIHYWTYGCSFANYFEPYNYLSAIPQSYREYAKLGGQFLMNQTDYNNDYAPDWTNLKTYIESKLMWNPNVDIRKYYYKFFRYYYGAAGDTMREYYEAYSMYDKINGRNFTEGILNGYLAYIDEAYDDIVALKYSDPDAYRLLYDRITVESMTPRVYLLEMKGYVWDWSYTRTFIAELQGDCRRLGITYYAENTPMDNYWTRWIN